MNQPSGYTLPTPELAAALKAALEHRGHDVTISERMPCVLYTHADFGDVAVCYAGVKVNQPAPASRER